MQRFFVSPLLDHLYFRVEREAWSRAQRRFWGGVILSILAHGLLLWLSPTLIRNDRESGNAGGGPLVVQLEKRSAASAAVPESIAPQSPQPPAKPTPTRPTMAAPVLTAPRSDVAIAAPTVEQPKPVEHPPDPTDFSSVLEARRAQRRAAESALAQGNSAARAGDRELSPEERAAANGQRNLKNLMGEGGTGGVFSILFKGHRYAQFAFNGWMPSRASNWREVIEVDAGPQGDVDRAIIRRMIELIRKYHQGNFNWESHRLGRVVVLSAKVEDTDGLEAFLIREFF